MGDFGRIDRVLKERSDYKSSEGNTPAKPPTTTEQVMAESAMSDPTPGTQDTASTKQSEVSFGGVQRASVFLA